MEYVPGGSIRSLLERFGALKESVVKMYTRQVSRTKTICEFVRVCVCVCVCTLMGRVHADFERLSPCLQLLLGLEYLHQNGIAHRST